MGYAQHLYYSSKMRLGRKATEFYRLGLDYDAHIQPSPPGEALQDTVLNEMTVTEFVTRLGCLAREVVASRERTRSRQRRTGDPPCLGAGRFCRIVVADADRLRFVARAEEAPAEDQAVTIDGVSHR